MASYWVFRRAVRCYSITSIIAFGGVGYAAAWRCSVKMVGSSTIPPVVLQRCSMTPIPHLYTASSSTVAVKKQKFKKRRQQSLQLVDQYHTSHLIRILDSEIKCALYSDLLHCDVDVPEGFPFKVVDIAGGRTILLEREFQGEAIMVQADMPTTTTSYAAGDEEGGVNDDRDTVEGNDETDPSIPLVVTVSKGNGSCLQFDARAFPGRILVNGLSSFNKNSGNSEEDGPLAYRGPDFLDLNDKFQKAIHDYLEIRGLTSSTATYLLEYMISKDTKDYLQWLRNLKKLIEQYHLSVESRLHSEFS